MSNRARARTIPDPDTVMSYQRGGAVCIRRLFDPEQVALLESGIEHNLREPSPRAKVASCPDDPGWFFEDFCNWQENDAPKANSAALKALALDDTLPEAHRSLAHIHFEFDHDWEAAEREYQCALELDPSHPTPTTGTAVT